MAKRKAPKTDDQLTNKQAYIRERSIFYSTPPNRIGAIGGNLVKRRCENDWNRLDAAGKVVAAAASRVRLAAVALGAAPVAQPTNAAGSNAAPHTQPDLDDVSTTGSAGPTGPPVKLVGEVDNDETEDKRKQEASERAPNLQGKIWRGKHYLGGGSYGHAHLYLELDDDENILSRMVVKDSWMDSSWSEICKWWGDVRDPPSRVPVEIKAMDLMKDLPGADVIVKLLRHKVYEAKRSYRIYMSYAEHGDCEQLRGRYPAARPSGVALKIGARTAAAASSTAVNPTHIPESAVWTFLEQLNQACILMEYGSLDDSARPAGWQEIVHQDIKPDNVFLGAPKGSSPYPQMILGDFGHALITSAGDTLNPLFFTHGMGTAGYSAPEQTMMYNEATSDPAPISKMLAWTNIYGMGATVARLMRGQRKDRPGDESTSEVEDRPNYADGPAADYEWFDGSTRSFYSNALCDLVLACLQYEPTSRPTNEDVRTSVQNYFAANERLENLEDDDERRLDFLADEYRLDTTYTGTLVG